MRPPRGQRHGFSTQVLLFSGEVIRSLRSSPEGNRALGFDCIDSGSLALDQSFKCREKSWVGDSGCLGAADKAFALSPQRGHGKCHGDAVIAE